MLILLVDGVLEYFPSSLVVDVLLACLPVDQVKAAPSEENAIYLAQQICKLSVRGVKRNSHCV